MRDKIQQIREKALAEIDKADGLEKLNDVRAAILGKKGELTAVLKGMKDVAPDFVLRKSSHENAFSHPLRTPDSQMHSE